ncbi:MAG TPA: hypothetical protein VKF59_14185 [Candidatus Dormibacteraeota bacterium]|nr:hypothetical protein [Candidatus Dormibacteraeota bacterium]
MRTTAARPRDLSVDLMEVDQADPAWRRLVAGQPEATPFHLPAWGRVLADAYGYSSIVLADPDGPGGVGAGALLVRLRRLGGPAWVSLPFSDHCQPLAQDAAGGACPCSHAASSMRCGGT